MATRGLPIGAPFRAAARRRGALVLVSVFALALGMAAAGGALAGRVELRARRAAVDAAQAENRTLRSRHAALLEQLVACERRLAEGVERAPRETSKLSL